MILLRPARNRSRHVGAELDFEGVDVEDVAKFGLSDGYGTSEDLAAEAH